MKKILIVDDMPQIRRAYLRILNDYEVKAAEDAIEARRILAEGFSPDVIISDWDMPRMNGGELCETLRAEGNATPFYIVSGHPRDHVKVGANGSLMKPFTREELDQILASV